MTTTPKNTDGQLTGGPVHTPMATERDSFTEAWCENCGARWQAPREHEVMVWAERHYSTCIHTDPNVLGETKVLWRVAEVEL